jgi:Protein of unknown function (DUF3995)
MEGATMVRIAAVFACITLAGTGLLHAYWAIGGHLAIVGTMPTAGGKPIFHPGRFWTFVVASSLFLMSVTVAIRIGWLLVPALRGVSRIGVWAMVAIFTVRATGDFRYVGFFKTVRNTQFAELDTLVYTPLCLLLAIAITIVALSEHAKAAGPTR